MAGEVGVSEEGEAASKPGGRERLDDDANVDSVESLGLLAKKLCTDGEAVAPAAVAAEAAEAATASRTTCPLQC